MKLLFTIVPSRSHLHAIVPIARALVRRGHQVAFATAARFQPVIAAAGFNGFAAGLDWIADEDGQTFRPSDFADRCAPPMVDDVTALSRELMPDVVVSDMLEFGGWIAADKLGVPHAMIGLSGGVALPHEWTRKTFGESLGALREFHGLRPDPMLEGLNEFLRIDLVPPGFRPPAVDPGPNTHDVRPVSIDDFTSATVRSWVVRAKLQHLPYPRTVLVTLGTVFNGDHDAFAICLAALADEHVNVIAAVGSTQDPRRFGPQPPHVRVERYLPFSLITDRVDALISHGGYLTVMTFLGAGVPMGIVPLAADHPLNAMRLVKMGAALTLKRADLNGDAVRTVVRALLDQPQYRAAAQRIRAEMLTQPGPDHAAALITQLAEERRPIPRLVAVGG